MVLKKRILVAGEKEFVQKILQFEKSGLYEFERALKGEECLKKIETFSPDLVLVDLFLPEVHGIEIIKRLSSKTGAILLAAHAMIQNYHAALVAGADDFFLTSLPVEELYDRIARYFSGTLTPALFPEEKSKEWQEKEEAKPFKGASLKFWGTRGSNPVSGKEYAHFGGNTPCLEIRQNDDLVILDAGTGIRALGEAPYVREAKNIHLVLGHTHWDHIIGFPFFAPIYNPNCHLTIWSPIGFEKPTRELFTEMLSYGYFPIGLNDIRARLDFKDILEGVPFKVGEIEMHSHYAYHPGATLGFKFQVGKKTYGYATDNEFLLGYHGDLLKIGEKSPLLDSYRSLIRFFKGCETLIHEAQYFPEEYEERVGWGHSSIPNASLLMKLCEVPKWLVTHHDPSHTDAVLERKYALHKETLKSCGHEGEVEMARDGLKVL